MAKKVIVGTCKVCGMINFDVGLDPSLDDGEKYENEVIDQKERNYLLLSHKCGDKDCEGVGKQPTAVYTTFKK